MARRSFSETFRHRYEPEPFSAFLDAPYGPGGTVSRDLNDPAIRWRVAQRHWLTVEALPGYAHDLNPVEQAWGNLKATELANLCPEHISEADTAAHTGPHRIGSSYDLCFNFLDHTGLRL
jgi:transposase